MATTKNPQIAGLEHVFQHFQDKTAENIQRTHREHSESTQITLREHFTDRAHPCPLTCFGYFSTQHEKYNEKGAKILQVIVANLKLYLLPISKETTRVQTGVVATEPFQRKL